METYQRRKTGRQAKRPLAAQQVPRLERVDPQRDLAEMTIRPDPALPQQEEAPDENNHSRQHGSKMANRSGQITEKYTHARTQLNEARLNDGEVCFAYDGGDKEKQHCKHRREKLEKIRKHEGSSCLPDWFA